MYFTAYHNYSHITNKKLNVIRAATQKVAVLTRRRFDQRLWRGIRETFVGRRETNEKSDVIENPAKRNRREVAYSGVGVFTWKLSAVVTFGTRVEEDITS